METCYSDFRNGLKSYVRYELFNKPVEEEVERLKCEELSGKLGMHKSFKKFCYMLSRNIKEVYTSLESHESSQEICEFLNYWLYDALIKINFLKDEENISQSSIMDKITELWNSSNYNKKCHLIKYNINTTDFMHMKALYDYSKNYLAIETNQQWEPENQCRKQYCSYIKKVDDVYKLVESACNSQDDKKFCEILRKIPGDKIPKLFLQSYKCTSDEMKEDHIKDDKIFTNPLLPDPQEESITPSFSEIPFSSTETSPEGSYKDKPEDASPNSSVKVGLSTFGMSLVPLFLIYKFTPGGNFLRRIINQKIGTNYNTGEIPSGDWFSISRAHQNDIQANREFNVLYQNMEKK